MNARTYSLLLALPILVLSVLALGLMAYLQPQSGDLSRIGARADRLFGWNQPQQAPLEAGVVIANTVRSVPDREMDLLVLGDSFSHFMPLNWVQHFQGATGWNSVVYHHQDLEPSRFAVSDAFRRHRPKLVVLQVVERSLPVLMGDLKDLPACAVVPVGEPVSGLPRGAMPGWSAVETRPWPRKQGLAGISTAMSYLIKHREGRKRVSEQGLSRADLFSHRYPDTLIYLKDDGQKYHASTEEVARIGCVLRTLQQQVEADAHTRFVVMVAPDKSSAYCPYFKQDPDKPVRCESIIEHLAVPGLNLLRLDRDIAKALEDGAVDVYLPNDTHWGGAGARIAAESLYRWLLAESAREVAAPVPERSAPE